MEPFKIKGLDLKSEVKEEVGLTPGSLETGEGMLGEVDGLGPVPEGVPYVPPSIQDNLTSIIHRVEALDKTDNQIKAIGKLKGALELLS